MRRMAIVASIVAVTVAGTNPPLIANRVVFIGDSITAQWDVQSAFPCAQAVNLGVSGNTSAQMIERFNDAIALSPAVVVIEVGVNDMRHDDPNWLQLFGNIAAMARMAHQTGARVIVLDVPQTFGVMQTQHTDPATIYALNSALQGAAAIAGYEFVPAFASIGAQDTRDGLHPTEAGYRKIEREIEEHIWTKRQSYLQSICHWWRH